MLRVEKLVSHLNPHTSNSLNPKSSTCHTSEVLHFFLQLFHIQYCKLVLKYWQWPWQLDYFFNCFCIMQTSSFTEVPGMEPLQMPRRNQYIHGCPCIYRVLNDSDSIRNECWKSKVVQGVHKSPAYKKVAFQKFICKGAFICPSLFPSQLCTHLRLVSAS